MTVSGPRLWGFNLFHRLYPIAGRTMKIALQLRLLPTGRTIADQCKWARDSGAEGIELTPQPDDELCAAADQVRKVLPVTTVCGLFDGQGTATYVRDCVQKAGA